MTVERMIQAAVVRADIALCAAWPYVRAALFAGALILFASLVADMATRNKPP